MPASSQIPPGPPGLNRIHLLVAQTLFWRLDFVWPATSNLWATAMGERVWGLHRPVEISPTPLCAVEALPRFDNHVFTCMRYVQSKDRTRDARAS